MMCSCLFCVYQERCGLMRAVPCGRSMWNREGGFCSMWIELPSMDWPRSAMASFILYNVGLGHV